jgi:hypothetical protein
MASENLTESNINGAIDNVDDHNLMQYTYHRASAALGKIRQAGGQVDDVVTSGRATTIHTSFINLLIGIFSTIIIEFYHHCQYLLDNVTKRTSTSYLHFKFSSFPLIPSCPSIFYHDDWGRNPVPMLQESAQKV